MLPSRRVAAGADYCRPQSWSGGLDFGQLGP
jgi:hypothetical protein